ncbi:MAG: hypothetical protein GX541_01210 [Clostridiales bacterium]|nr:hypothetical protein [Clostridiales bacterium]
MKSSDSFDLFEVFKPGYMDGATFRQKFFYWFRNVYWYHYKKQTLLAIFGLILLCVFIGDIVYREKYDLCLIVGGDTMVESEALSKLSEELKTVIPDADGDGKINIKYQMLYTGLLRDKPEEGQVFDEMLGAAVQKIQLSFADDDTLLFILDKSFADWYAAEGAFEPLSGMDIASENEYCVRADEKELFKKLGIKNPGGWYAGIKVKNESRAKNPKILKKYEAAEAALKAIAK